MNEEIIYNIIEEEKVLGLDDLSRGMFILSSYKESKKLYKVNKISKEQLEELKIRASVYNR